MKLSFPLKLSAVLFVLLSLSLQAQSALADSPPNIVVFLSDDQGWGDFGFQGNSNFQTPNLDQLAHSGAVCQRFYVCPVCAPTRAEFLTGRYHPRGSAMGVTQGDERLDLDETTLADRFKKAGYATGAFGKWHKLFLTTPGTQRKQSPRQRLCRRRLHQPCNRFH